MISQPCDYREICNTYQPDLTLFESGIESAPCYRNIKNTFAYPEIPKLGFYNGDPFCGCRSAFLSDMEEWGIQTFFTISVPLAEYMPEVAEKIFVWPNFIDPNIYQDYGHKKIIPILFTGRYSSLYPWRNRIQKILSQYYPSLTCPHLGYDQQTASRMLFADQYATTINASWFVPACGTMAKEVVRKHFEIPGCKSCLITEKTPALEAAGFVDMQNCVFADETDVLDKIDYLFQNPEELEKIINAGYQLVQSRHTFKQRDQILQWFNLNRILQSGQRIVQKGPFEPLTIVEESSGIRNSHIISNGLDRVLLHQGDEKLWAGKYDQAEALYLSCLNYIDYMPEPKLRLAMCNLYKGRAKAALHWIVQPIQWTLVSNKASTPDPVEWAYFIISLLCQGKLKDAIKRAEQFPSLCHPELARTRWVIQVLKNPKHQISVLDGDLSKCRASVQQLPNTNFNEWINNVCMVFKACNQFEFAEILGNAVSSKCQPLERIQNPFFIGTYFYQRVQQEILHFCKKKINKIIEYLLNPTEYDKTKKIIKIKIYKLSITAKPFCITLIGRLLSKLKPRTLQILNFLETLFGCFLPYSLSIMKNDEFFSAVQKLIREENIKTSLVIGASIEKGSTKASLAGIQENRSKPTLFCVNFPKPQFLKLQKRFVHDSFVKCHNILPSSNKNLSNQNEATKFIDTLHIDLSSTSWEDDLDLLCKDIECIKENKIFENCIRQIKNDNKIDCFDIVLIAGSEFRALSELDQLYGAKFILLEDINTPQNFSNIHKLLADTNYILVDQNPSLRNGYAVFKKIDSNEVTSGTQIF
ncbi:glycosyltransferase [Aetokthonos hydrillicola]|uniref:glycosyltransferase n=1 Tax=Aetokthonos hydrillicola TaxID=1550245 RepID=UPI0030D87165